jgi:hypothetical protein
MRNIASNGEADLGSIIYKYATLFNLIRLNKEIFTKKKLEAVMNEEAFNLSMRKFLKMVGVSSQNEIEKAVGKAMADKSITGSETLPATMTLEIAGLKLNVKFDGNISLE